LLKELYVYTQAYSTNAKLFLFSVLERAAVYIGTDYLAGAFWDKYLEFELAHKEFGNATALFVHLLSLSLESIGKYFER